MPGKNMSPGAEKDWQSSKSIVKDETGKSQKKFKDRQWGLTMHIFKAKRKKHTGKPFKKKKAAVIADLVSFATFLDDRGLFKQADAVDSFVKEALTSWGVVDEQTE